MLKEEMTARQYFCAAAELTQSCGDIVHDPHTLDWRFGPDRGKKYGVFE